MTNRHDEVWVIDDDRSIRWVLERAFSQSQINVTCFESGMGVMSKLRQQQPHAIISDIRMPDLDGLQLLTEIRAEFPTLPVVIMTAHSDLDSAVSAYQGGAFEYLPKPFDVDEAVAVIKRAIEHSRENSRNNAQNITPAAPEIIGEAPAMQEVFRAIGRLSNSNITVLINGESGTGKELVARALHRHSPRREMPCVALNMAAIPRDLIESELFGHERGAFTGATAMRRGRFEQADGGTHVALRRTLPRATALLLVLWWGILLTWWGTLVFLPPPEGVDPRGWWIWWWVLMAASTAGPAVGWIGGWTSLRARLHELRTALGSPAPEEP